MNKGLLTREQQQQIQLQLGKSLQLFTAQLNSWQPEKGQTSDTVNIKIEELKKSKSELNELLTVLQSQKKASTSIAQMKKITDTIDVQMERYKKIMKSLIDFRIDFKRSNSIMGSYQDSRLDSNFQVRQSIANSSEHQQQQNNKQQINNGYDVDEEDIENNQTMEQMNPQEAELHNRADLEDELQQERQEEIDQIEYEVGQMKDMMQDMHEIVVADAEKVDVIEENVVETKENVVETNKIMETNDKVQASSTKKIIFMVSAILLIVIALIVVLVFSL